MARLLPSALLVLLMGATQGCIILQAALGPSADSVVSETAYPNLRVRIGAMKADSGRVRSVNHPDSWVKSPYTVDAVIASNLFTENNVNGSALPPEVEIEFELLDVKDLGCQNMRAGRWDLVTSMRAVARDAFSRQVIHQGVYKFESHDSVMGCSQFEMEFGKLMKRKYVSSELGFSPNRAFPAMVRPFLLELRDTMARGAWKRRDEANREALAVLQQASPKLNARELDGAAALLDAYVDSRDVNPFFRVQLQGLKANLASQRSEQGKVQTANAAAQSILQEYSKVLHPLLVPFLETAVSANLIIGAVEARDTALVEELEQRRMLYWEKLRPQIEAAGLGQEFVRIDGDSTGIHVDIVAIGLTQAWLDLAFIAMSRQDHEAAARYLDAAWNYADSVTDRQAAFRTQIALVVDFGRMAVGMRPMGELASIDALIASPTLLPVSQLVLERYRKVLGV